MPHTGLTTFQSYLNWVFDGAVDLEIDEFTLPSEAHMRRVRLYILGNDLRDKPLRVAMVRLLVDAYINPDDPPPELPGLDSINLVYERTDPGCYLRWFMVFLYAFRMDRSDLRGYLDQLPRAFLNELLNMLA